MTLTGPVFYVISAIVLAATVLAVTRRHPVYALVYLIFSFLGTALLFYLLGAPFLAGLEVIIYAGAILVLFLFVVMTVRSESPPRPFGKRVWPWVPALLLGGVSLIIASTLLFAASASHQGLTGAVAYPRVLGHFVFDRYWFPVEVVSLLLTIALVGAYFLGREDRKLKDPPRKEIP